MKKTNVLIISCFFFMQLQTLNLQAQFAVSRLYNDHMVIQRHQPIVVWGWAKSGDKVTVRFNAKDFSAKTEKTGKWKVTLPEMPAGGPFEMEITCGKDAKKIKDISPELLKGEIERIANNYGMYAGWYK